jgi:hypothetical protein
LYGGGEAAEEVGKEVFVISTLLTLSVSALTINKYHQGILGEFCNVALKKFEKPILASMTVLY